MQTEGGGGMAIFWPVCLGGREREAPSRDLIFITDVGMGAEYIRISLSPHFSVRQHTTKFNFGHLMMGPENLRCHVKYLRVNRFS